MPPRPRRAPAPAAHHANAGVAPIAAPAARDLIGGLTNGLAVIDAFDSEGPELTIAEVARRCGFTRAAARRYLLTLVHVGYVSADDGAFSLTPKVLRLGQSYLRSSRLARIVHPQLFRIGQTLHEACSVGILDGGDLVCVAATTAGKAVSPTLQPGNCIAAWCTANGRTLLAALPPDLLDDWFDAVTLEPLTPHTIVDKKRLREELAMIAAKGYACVDEELELGLRTIAVPLKNRAGNTVAAMNVSVHSGRMSIEQMRARCLPPLLESQAQIRSML